MLRSLEKRPRNLTVAARYVTFEPSTPLLDGRSEARRRTWGHPPYDVRQNSRSLIIIPVYGHADERIAWLQTFKQHRPVDVVKDSDDPVSVEGIQYGARMPFVSVISNDFQNDRLTASPPESHDRAFGFHLMLDSHPPSIDSIIDSTPELRRDCRIHPNTRRRLTHWRSPMAPFLAERYPKRAPSGQSQQQCCTEEKRVAPHTVPSG